MMSVINDNKERHLPHENNHKTTKNAFAKMANGVVRLNIGTYSTSSGLTWAAYAHSASQAITSRLTVRIICPKKRLKKFLGLRFNLIVIRYPALP